MFYCPHTLKLVAFSIFIKEVHLIRMLNSNEYNLYEIKNLIFAQYTNQIFIIDVTCVSVYMLPVMYQTLTLY